MGRRWSVRARKTGDGRRTFARQLGLKLCFTPVRSPQSNGISEAFVHTLKRDYVSTNRVRSQAVEDANVPAESG